MTLLKKIKEFFNQPDDFDLIEERFYQKLEDMEQHPEKYQHILNSSSGACLYDKESMMNKRIKELAESCMIEEYNQHGNLIEFGFDYEKFAESIIQECMDVALDRKKWVEDQVVFDPRDQAWNKARIQQSQHIVDKIKEHFGVE